MSADVMSLVGADTHARALLEGVQEKLSGADLEGCLKEHAQPALFAVGLAEAFFLFFQLEHAVEEREAFYTDRAMAKDWPAEDFDAEVLAHLFELRSGFKPCRHCLNGSLLAGLDAFRPVGHQTASAAA